MKNIIKILVAVAVIVTMAVSVSAAVTTFELVPFNEAANEWEITVHINLELDDSVANSHVNTFAAQFFFNPEKLVLCDLNYEPVTDYYAAGTTPIYCYPVKQGRIEYSYEAKPINDEGVSQMWLPQADGTVRGYVIVNSADEKFDSNDNLMFSIAFKLADGVSVDDLAYNDFVIHQLFAEDTYLGTYGYNYEAATDKQMDCSNTVVPEAPVVVPVTIPVTAGDIVYLQDGTKVNIAETNEAYVLTADVGYVAVNTGYDAQKTYYINGTSAELVHTDAVLGSELYSLRDRTPVYDAVKGEEIDKNGLRFQMLSSQSSRKVADPHDVVEAGFLMTAKVQKVVDAYGESPELTHDKVESGLGLVKKGVAYDPANGIDIRMGSEDGIIDIRGVFYNIPITQKNVTTTIISRPYYKVGNTYVYGEASETTLYDVAVALRASENWDTMSEGQQNYVNEIVAQVDGWTEIVEEEIVIDIGGLYGSN